MSDPAVPVTETPMLAEDEVGLLAPLYPLPRLELVEGQGAWVRDAGGRAYLDFTSGIAVNAFGHSPRGLAETVAAQLARLGHCSNLFANEPALALAKELTHATGYPRVFFCNSGTEGLDAALKFTRARSRALGMPGPVVCQPYYNLLNRMPEVEVLPACGRYPGHPAGRRLKSLEAA